MDADTRAQLARIALGQYENEPCRVCGEPLTWVDLQTAVFAGYSQDNTSRAAHKPCFDRNVPKSEWKKQ